MATITITLDETYQLMAAGACTVQFAQELQHESSPTPNESVASNPEFVKAFVHIGGSVPANDTFDYHEVTGVLNYQGTENVYMRAQKGTRVVKVTPII